MISTALGTTASAPLNTSWYVSGLGAGTVGSVVFSDVEHLIGADDNEDEFVFSATGGVTGTVEGGARGFDTIVLNGGDFDTVTYKAFNGNDGTIARDSNVLVYTGFEPLVDKTEGGTRIIETSDQADNIKVSRNLDGKIKIESVDPTPTFEHVIFDVDPTALTIRTGAESILASGSDTVTIEALTYAGDLTIETGSLNRMADAEDTITFAGNVTLQGKKLQASAENITINSGVVVSTSDAGGVAGSITLNSWHTTISANAKLLAEGTTAGDITINAIDENAIFTPILNIDIKDVGVTVATGAEIKGGDVTIIAKADNRVIVNTAESSILEPSTWGSIAADFGLSLLDSLLGVVAVGKSTATVDIQTGTTIDAKGNFEARASSYVAAVATPVTPFLAIGIALTDTTVTIGGQVTAGGKATIVATAEHTVNVLSDSTGIKGVAPSAALSIIDSDVTAHVTDDATLTIGGDLLVKASTIDRNRTMARSTSGKDGDVAVAIAVTVEGGQTSAYLDGTVTAANVDVVASMQKEVVPINQLFIVPSLGNGTAAIAGAGTDSKGDLLDDTKAKAIADAKGGISTFGTWVKEKFTGPASDKQQKDGTVTKDNVRSFDVAAAIAVVVDSNITTARIGDGIADGTGTNGSVSATGDVNVLSSVKSRPDITAGSSAATNPDATNTQAAETKFGGSLAVAVGVYTNEAYAQISELASVNSDKQITVDAKALNEIDPLGLWGVNLITPFLSSANYDTTQGSQEVQVGEIVDVKSNHTAGGDSGTWYKFIGDSAETIALGAEDFSDDSRWESLGNPVKHILLDKWLPTAATYLNDNLGLDANLVDTWTQAVAEGQKTAVAGAVTVLDFDQTAEAVIKSGAKINQPLAGGTATTNGDQDVVVGATSTAHFVNFSGNVKLPGVTGTKDSYKPSFSSPGLGSKSAEGGDAVGATVMVFDIDNTTIARIEDGVTLAADSLQVTADTFVVSAALGASGGESDDFGLNGAFIVSMVENTTLAHIENGATIAVGSKAVADTTGSGASVFLDAQDKTYVVTVSGGVATSEHIGVGLSVGVNMLTRNTEALIGNRHDGSSADTRGLLTVQGDVRLNARNEGFAGTIVIAGSKASQKSEDPNATSGSTGMQKSDGSTTDDPGKWPNNQKNYDSVIAELKQKQMGGSAPEADESTGKKQGKAGIAVSGAAAVNVIDDNARAYMHELGVLTATGKSITLAAANDTHVGSLAGGIAFAGKADSATTDVAVAGAFGGNFVSGTTQSFLDDVTSVSSKTLTIEADRGGWVVSLTAGVSGASGRKGIAVGGSVGVTMTDYTTEALLSSTTGTIAGALTIDASDDTNIILVAGSAGFGGKAGVGAAVAFAEIGNTTRATIQSVTDLKVTGPLSVLATSDGLIIAVTGSVGVGTGEGKGGGGAGTVTVNRIANVVEARILSSTFHADSTGDIRIDATDNSFIFSFAGAFGAGKTAGLGVAAAVNLLDNTVRATVSGSTLRTTGTLDVDADQTGTLVSVALGVGSGEQFAGAGSITVNMIDNTIEATIVDGSDVKVGGAIDISADDRSVGVSIAGGLAFGEKMAVGAAFAGNFTTNTLAARVDDSLVESTGSSASVGAEARATLVSVAIGGAGGKTFALGGSISVNQVENTIEASVTDKNGATGKASLLKAKNDISIAAADDTTMVVVAGGAAFSAKMALGLSASTTQIQNKVHAYVDASEVNSTSGKISVTAGFKPPDTDATLEAISVGTTGVEMPEVGGSQVVNIAVGVAGSGTFAGGGAFSLNWIRNDVQADAVKGAKVTAAGDITFAAIDDPEIDSFAVGGGIGTGTAGAALGLSYNYIGGDPGNPSRDIPSNPASANVGKAIASVNASTITSTGGSVSVLAGTTPKIINATIAGAGGGTAGVGGSFSINFIRSIVDASVTGGSNITANQDLRVGASATPVMITIAGNVNIGGTAGIGVASATNDMQSKITATIDSSRAKATNGNIIVDASIGKAATLPTLDTDVPVDAQIWTFAVAGSGAGNAAVAGSLSLNWIRNDVQAKISNIGNIDASADEISAGGKISVTATDASTINAIAGAISVALSSGSGAAGAAVAYNYLGGDPNNPGTTDNNKVTAAIENVTGQLKAGSIDVKASYTGSVNNITLGAAGAQNFALGGSVSINKIRNTADGHISGSTGISTTSGNITIEAKDTSTIKALAGGVGIAIAAGGGVAGAVGISVGVNTIENTTKAYIDKSSLTSAAGLALTADSKQTIQTLTVGGAVGVSGGDGVALTAAGAGSGNTVSNQVLAYISNSGGAHEVKANNGSIVLTAKDESKIQAASGGVAVSVAVGSTASAGASFGVSASDNDIDNTVKAYIDASKVTATNGDVELKATENATIEAFALAGSATGAGGGLIGGAAFAGAGAGARNTIDNTVQAYISGSSTVSTVTSGAVKLTATDTSKIKVDSGGVAIALAGGGGGGLAAAVGASVAINDITNTIQAYVDTSTITSAGAVELTAASTPTIDALSLSGALAASGGGGGGVSVAGSGASSTNTIANTVEAYAKSASLTSQNAAAIKLTATETALIKANTVGAAAAIAVGSAAGTVAIGVSIADNEVKSAIRAYSDQTTITSAGALDLKASSSSTAESLSVAVSLAVSAAPAGVAFSGGGANSTSRVHNTVEAYAKGTAAAKSSITAAGLITISASETSHLTADVGAGSMSIGLIGASVGVSVASNKADSTVKAYVDNVNLTSTGGGVSILASADDTIAKTLGVATSIAISIGGAGAGAEATATVTPNVDAYIGGGALVKAGLDVGVSAQSKASLDAQTFGLAAGLLAVGGSVSNATAGGTITAHVDGVIASSKNVNVLADATQTANARATALTGGIIAGAGASGFATVNPTVKAYGTGNITASETVAFAATATPSALSSALGVSAGVAAVGVSNATALATPTLEARPGGASTIITAKALNVSSSMTVPTSSYTAKTQATGATGGLISVNATESKATTSGKVYSSVAGGTTLVISDAISITAVGDSKQRADADSFNVGLIAAGGNEASANASVDTRAFLEAEVNVSNGTDIGGLGDGGRYYVILDDVRSFLAGGVDAGANSIDIGADHGLVTGDRVVFRETKDTPIGGLNSLETYSVETVAGTNRVRLLELDAEKGTVGNIADITSAAAGTLLLSDPRRVRLSGSSEGALKTPTQIIDLNSATASGTKHSLTPLTGFAAGAFEFNPGLNVNSAANTIELPSGHKLLTGQAVTYGRSGGAALTISATGTDYSHAISESGSGGLVAGSAAMANTTGSSGTRAYIADDSDGDGTKTSLRVSKLMIAADHTSRYDSELSTIQASLVGYSGAWAGNDVKTTVEATIGASADIQTQDLQVTAVNRTRKDIVGANNVKSGSGGVFQGNNAESVTTIENRTRATIGDGASVKVTGSLLAPGNFLLSALNDHAGDDEVLLDTGGVFAGSGVTSQIRVNVNEAVASIGQNAAIETVGALDLQTRTIADLGVHATAHTYGLAGGAGVDSEILIHTSNSVSIGKDTKVQALGDINLLAGRDRDGSRNFFKLRSEGDDLNATAVPISTLRSEVNITQNHAVNVAGGAELKGARDANLTAEQLSTADLVAFGSGKNWLTAVAGGIDSLLGGGMSEEEKGGKITNVKTLAVTVDGTVEVGILKDQKLTIEKGDAKGESSLIKITENVGGIVATTTIESLANNLVAERRRLITLISEYQGDLTTVAAYTAALQQVEAQMTQMGLSTTTDDGTLFFVEEYNVPYVTLDPIWAQSGTIRINADTVGGTGALKAPGDVNVTITNNSPAFLRIKGITIPDTAGGVVRLNGENVTTIAGFGGTIVSSKDGGVPTITIKSNFDEESAENQFDPDDPTKPWHLFRTPDIEIVGAVENVSGNVTIASAGSIISRANIVAGKLTITAGKDFVLTSKDSLFNVGGSPASIAGPWSETQKAAELYGPSFGGAAVSVSSNANSGVFGSQVAAALAAGNNSNIVAANNVIIVAQSLNVNGILQSGIADYSAHITEGFQSKIDAAELARAAYLQGNTFGAAIIAGLSGLEADQGYTYFKLTGPALTVDESGLEYAKNPGGNNLPVFYNAANDRLEVNGAKVQGGFMSLTGRILNTNPAAEIRVMDGYGRINVTNDLNIPLLINKLDTSSGIEGKLIITDSGKTSGGAPIVTEYTRVGADVQKKQYYFVTPGTTPTIINSETDDNSRTASYTPESTNYRFFWNTGNDLTKRTTTTYGTSAWLGIDALAADPGNIVEGPTIQYANPRALLTGSYVQPNASGADYTYDFKRITTSTEQKEIIDKWSTSTWYGTTTYYTKELKWQGQKDIHTHSIRADRPISINFIGYDEGAAQVNVTTAGSLLINGEVQNAQGTTALKANHGSITLINDSATVGGNSIMLTASNGSIGADAPIRTNLINGGGGSLSAAGSSTIRIQEISGDLTVNQVTIAQSGDRVELKAPGSILGVGGNLVQGGLIILEAGGSVGSLGTGGTARAPGAGAVAININTGVSDRDTLTVKAQGNVFLNETAGDVRLVSIDTTDADTGVAAGDVRLTVASGRLIDANTLQVTDPRTEAQLLGIWERMNATESTAHVSIEATVRSFEQLRTREYQAYWNFRHSQSDGGAKFDDTFKVTLSSAEREAYNDYYASQGMTTADIDAAILTLENGRTQEYRDLHQTYGKFGETFDDAYRYGTAVTQAFGGAAVHDGNNTVTLKGHAFDTGDAVVYHGGGGTVDGLDDGTTYYVVLDPATTGGFKLAGTRDEALTATPIVIDLGAVTGSTNVFSAADLTFADAAVDNDKNTITLAKHTFQTGQEVVFRSQGGTITGLDDSSRYFVVVDETDRSKIRLAASHADATLMLPVVIDIGAVAGSGFFFSEADVLAQKAAWSETQLKNSFSSKILGPKGSSGTTATIEAANVIGKNVALKVSSDVGSIEASIDIILPLVGELSTAQTLALASADRSDVTFYEDAAGTIEIDDPRDTSATVRLIRVVPKADVDVTVKGVLTVESGKTVNLGSEEAINIDQVKAAQAARITGQKALTNAQISAVNVISGDLILEAEDEGIGTSGAPLVLDLNAGATLVARAQDDVFIRENAGDLSIVEVTSTQGNVTLQADQSILDADDDDAFAFGADWNILAGSVTLEAGKGAGTAGSIGTATNYLEIDVRSGGTVNALGDTGVHLHEVTGDMLVDLVKANGGDVRLRAAASMLEVNDLATDVFGRSIMLTADFGSLGAPLADLEIDSSFGSAGIGSVTTKSATNVHLVENAGDLRLDSVSVDAGTAFIKAVNGSILDADSNEATHNVLSGKVWLFASKDIGEAAHRLTSKSGNLEAESTTGSTYILNTGALEVGGVTASDTGIKAGGEANVTSKSPLTVATHVTAVGNITLHATDGPTSGDFLVVKNGVKVSSSTGSVEMLAGDNLTIEQGAFVDAKTSIILRGDYQPVDVDVKGSTILVDGSLTAPNIQIHGYQATDSILLRPESLVGDTQVFGMGGADVITLDRLPSITTTQQIAGMVVRDTIDLDGGEGADSYVINITGGKTDYLVNINDTGASTDDEVTINATADNDLFLLREKFVAYLVPETPLTAGVQPGQAHLEVERINYNSSIDHLKINTLGGDDQIYVDDNSAKTTLDGGIGKDFFQFGQLFGSERKAPAVALGDEISALRTTLGWLSRGVSYQTTAMGGDGEDTFQVYSNQAELQLEGNDGDDTFIVRSFALADENGNAKADQSMSKLASAMGGTGNDVVQYNVNANLAIDGGGGDDRFILLGSELSDDFVITATSVFGGGHSITYQNVERITVDGLQGNDNFFILGTKAGAVTTVAGGHGWDTFHVSGDITRPIVSKAFLESPLAGNHLAAGAIGGPLIIEGGFGPDDFSLRQAVILPTETDELLTQLVNPTDDDDSIDTLHIFNDGSSANDVATLTDVNFRIEGMADELTLGSGAKIAGGITYQNVETLEIMLGSGDDALTIESTMNDAVDGDRGPLTIVHGGGGSDTITVNGGGGADSPLVIFGDTEQDGARYAGMKGESKLSGQAWQFMNPGDDIINASAADGAVAIFGGRGVDTITGSAFGDQLAGGSGDDTIYGLGGDDIVYGDSGFNLDEAAVTIPEPNNVGGTASRIVYERDLVVVDTPDSGAAAWADTLTGSDDDLYGGEGDDIVIGDLGVVEQVLAENLYDTSKVILVTTKSVESGGDDFIEATPGDDIVLGGSGADTIDAGDGDNIVIGDNGIVELQSPDGLRFRIASTDFAFGGIDTITTLSGHDIVLGGNAGDIIDAGDGGNIAFGDDGEIVYATDGRLSLITSTSTTEHGGIDGITTGAGQDLVLGGRFGDTIDAGAGNNVVFGDSGRLVADAASTTEHWSGHPLPAGTIESLEHGDGGDDTITSLGGQDIVLGGNAADTIDAGDGDNLVFGDDGQIVYATDGRLSLITSTSTTEHGGVDNITTGAGQDIVLGGRFGDTIHAGAGNNMVFGDSGQLVADPTSLVYPWASHPLPIDMLETIEPGDGGNDTITTLGGSDLLIGGDGGDTLDSGAGDDFIVADHATVEYADGIAITITTTDTAIGGDDTIRAGADDDVVIGGTGDDAIDGGAGRDLLFGDSVTLDRSSTLGDFRNPRFRALMGTEIYSIAEATAGQLLIDTGAYYADPRGPAEWGDFQITLLHHDDSTPATLYGDDYLAGGADDDAIFAQLGDDVVQGDGSIDFVSGGGRVGAFRDAAGDLQIRASFEAVADGHDYIEGGGGQDVLFGNNGQDDIIGGSSSLFSNVSPTLRPDGADLIFGGAGTDAGRNDAGDGSAQGHANDADTIVGDNGNIYRLVGVNGAPAGGDGVATFNGFLSFNYDTYTTGLPAGEQVHIVPRGITLIDYTPGGPDFAGEAGPMVVGDIGGADEIHGEAGDDIAYGGAGNDVLFGDAQDDDLIGGYGHDWISGGTGDDGILGDDGRVFTSRNGIAEPLNGVATASVETLLEGNGNGSINATVHVTGTLQKHVDLTPFYLDPDHVTPGMLHDPQYADDIIFGGLGRDFIHAGAGDDAVSGAEALDTAYLVNGGGLVRSDFNRPFNPGDALAYDETSTLFAQYDPANAMSRILLNADGTLSTTGTGAEFFLNFDPTEGPLVAGSTTVHTDGDDIIFGDLGNDWMVGGTGRDHIWAGWGDDLSNVDDDHTTSGGLNNTPDSQASYADFVYGGAGRDVLIANTSGDVLVDTTGEFDTFLVPFSKYGPPTVNRAINPALEQFLYSLGTSDGADQTLASSTSGTGSTARHGEPFGELGLVTQEDAAAGDQRGGPRDPQAGNTGGSSADSTTTTSSGGKKAASSEPVTTATSTGTTDSTSSLTSSDETSTTSAPSTTSTPSIDWSGKTADVTLLPWAQGTQAPIGLSVPEFDVDEDDEDDLIDWAAAPAAAPETAPQPTTPTLSMSGSNNGNGNAYGNGNGNSSNKK